jgi:hypothetical protein
MVRSRPKWSVAAARRRFATLLKSAVHEPQAVYRRGSMAAVVVGPEIYRHLSGGKDRGTLADAFAELREICRKERYRLKTPPRRDRPQPFVKALRELAR